MGKAEIKRFRENLRNGAMKFTYKKKSDGSIRTARGTLDKRLMPTSLKDWKRKTNRRAPMSSIVYYDLDKQEIRSFKDYLFQKMLKRKTYSQIADEYPSVRQANAKQSIDKPEQTPEQKPKEEDTKKEDAAGQAEDDGKKS